MKKELLDWWNLIVDLSAVGYLVIMLALVLSMSIGSFVYLLILTIPHNFLMFLCLSTVMILGAKLLLNWVNK